MLFNSLTFLVFFAIVWPVWWALPPRWGRAWLLAASWVFYGAWDVQFLGLLLFSTGLDFALGLLLEDPSRRHRRALLWLSVAANLGLLAVFKYLGFFTRELDALLTTLGLPSALPVWEVALPVGLSFYTFQSLSYTIDVYRGQVRACRDPIVYALYVAFFPQLVAGPIERSGHLIQQLEAQRRPTDDAFSEGLQLVLWGFFKKVFVADNLAIVVERIFDGDAPTSGATALLGAVAFTWQIYGDFSGYSDIARGLGRWLGVDFMVNFRLPLFATSPRELWRRWHISLSTWLRDYLYIPLGGSRQGEGRTRFNLMATMVLGGLWHGANWTFVLWGALHGAALALSRGARGPALPGWLALPGMFLFTTLTFLVFRCHDLGQVWGLLSLMVTTPSPDEMTTATFRQLLLIAGPLAAVEAVMAWRRDPDLLLHLPPQAQTAIAVILLLVIVLLGQTNGQKFIYFQF